jgi:hypothetical protein
MMRVTWPTQSEFVFPSALIPPVTAGLVVLMTAQPDAKCRRGKTPVVTVAYVFLDSFSRLHYVTCKLTGRMADQELARRRGAAPTGCPVRIRPGRHLYARHGAAETLSCCGPLNKRRVGCAVEVGGKPQSFSGHAHCRPVRCVP